MGQTVDCADGRILGNGSSLHIPASPVALLFRNSRVIPISQKVAVLYLHGLYGNPIRYKGDCVGSHSVVCPNNQVRSNRLRVLVPAHAIPCHFRELRIIPVLQHIAMAYCHRLDQSTVVNKPNQMI